MSPHLPSGPHDSLYSQEFGQPGSSDSHKVWLFPSPCMTYPDKQLPGHLRKIAYIFIMLLQGLSPKTPFIRDAHSFLGPDEDMESSWRASYQTSRKRYQSPQFCKSNRTFFFSSADHRLWPWLSLIALPSGAMTGKFLTCQILSPK